jgi:hypothetical protein
VIRLLIAIVLSFTLLTLPHHTRLLWMAHLPPSYDHCNSSIIVLFQPIAFLLLFLNSGINPLLYAFFSARFRSACHDLLILQRQRSDFYLKKSNGATLNASARLHVDALKAKCASNGTDKGERGMICANYFCLSISAVNGSTTSHYQRQMSEQQKLIVNKNHPADLNAIYV